MVLKDGKLLVLLTVQTDSKKITTLEETVVDAFTDSLSKGNVLVGMSSFCFYQNKRWEQGDYEPIIAIVTKEDVEVYTDIKKAWKINTKLNRFEEIPVKDIECVNDGYGV